MTGVAILHQEHPFQPPKPRTKGPQLLDVVLRVLCGLDRHFHPARVDDQEEQQVDGPVPGLLKLLVFDGTGDGSMDRATLQHLMVGLLIEGHNPDALTGESFRMSIESKDLLCPFFELAVEAGRPPVARAVRLQVHRVENPTDGAWADGVHDAVGNRLAGQVLAGPVRKVQPLGNWLQASQLDDLSPLEGGEISCGCPTWGSSNRKRCQPLCS